MSAEVAADTVVGLQIKEKGVKKTHMAVNMAADSPAWDGERQRTTCNLKSSLIVTLGPVGLWELQEQ